MTVPKGFLSTNCSVCGKEVFFANLEAKTYCEDCCPDHEYCYDKEEQAHICRNCFKHAPPEFYYDD